MAIPILRTLTRKSKLGFGKYKDYTVQHLLDLKRGDVLVSPYYKLTSINYTDDILDELKIKGAFIIPKPSKSIETYYLYLDKYAGIKHDRGKGSDKLKKRIKHPTKFQMQTINHGRN